MKCVWPRSAVFCQCLDRGAGTRAESSSKCEAAFVCTSSQRSIINHRISRSHKPAGVVGLGWGGHMSHFKHYHQPLDAVYHYTHVLLMHDNTAGQLRKYTVVRLTRAWKKVSFCRQNKQGAHSVQIIGVCVDAEVPKDNQGFVSHKKCRLAPSLKANDHIRVASGCWSVKPLNVLLCQENVPAPSIQPHEKETGGEPLPQANTKKKKNEWMDLWTQVCHIAVRDVLSWVFCLVKFMFYLER